MLVTGNVEASSSHVDSPQAVRPQDKDNGRHVLDMLGVTNASFLPNLDIVDNTKIEALENQIQVLNTKYAAMESMLETLRLQTLRISHHLDILDTSYQGEQFGYSLQ